MPVAVGQRASRSLTIATDHVRTFAENVTRGDGTTVLEGVAGVSSSFHENWGDRAKTHLVVPAA